METFMGRPVHRASPAKIGTKKEAKGLAKSGKFRRVMKEYGSGELHSSSGEKVTDVEQAKAIAFSEARRAKKGHR